MAFISFSWVGNEFPAVSQRSRRRLRITHRAILLFNVSDCALSLCRCIGPHDTEFRGKPCTIAFFVISGEINVFLDDAMWKFAACIDHGPSSQVLCRPHNLSKEVLPSTQRIIEVNTSMIVYFIWGLHTMLIVPKPKTQECCDSKIIHIIS